METKNLEEEMKRNLKKLMSKIEEQTKLEQTRPLEGDNNMEDELKTIKGALNTIIRLNDEVSSGKCTPSEAIAQVEIKMKEIKELREKYEKLTSTKSTPVLDDNFLLTLKTALLKNKRIESYYDNIETKKQLETANEKAINNNLITLALIMRCGNMRKFTLENPLYDVTVSIKFKDID